MAKFFPVPAHPINPDEATAWQAGFNEGLRDGRKMTRSQIREAMQAEHGATAWEFGGIAGLEAALEEMDSTTH